MSEHTSDFELRMELITIRTSNDPAKMDMELTCGRCTGVICDVEHDDTLDLLVRTAEGHLAQCEPFECKHCGRTIYPIEGGLWVCPEAGTDVEDGDGIWRETCEDNHEDRIAAHEPKVVIRSGPPCGPVAATWFGTGQWPTCACGLDPHDNAVLTAHWRAQGFEVVDQHGQLITIEKEDS